MHGRVSARLDRILWASAALVMVTAGLKVRPHYPTAIRQPMPIDVNETATGPADLVWETSGSEVHSSVFRAGGSAGTW